jgi:hypothetical protein
MKIYETISTNIDIQDGEFDKVLYISKERAIQAMRDLVSNKQATNIVEDIDGKLESYDMRNLEFTKFNGCPAIYYRSHYGNYRMVIWIRERIVIE